MENDVKLQTGGPAESGSKKQQNVADQIVDMMAVAGIKNMYAITGDSLNALTDAVSRDGRVRFIHVRHEESGAFAASAEAQLTGRLACCAGSSGPGHVHLINGLYDAQRSGAPVLAIASTCPSGVYGTGYFQETDPILLFSDCSVYNHTAVTPAQVPTMLQEAMQHALGRRGVGIIGLPQDVTLLPQQDGVGSMRPLPTDGVPTLSADDAERCRSILDAGRKVTIFAGSGAAGAHDVLMQLARRLKAPVVTTFKSQLELTLDCPNYVGHVGYLGMWSAAEALSEADVILIIGTNFPFPGFFPKGREIIQVDVRADRIGKKADVTAGICCDAGVFLSAMLSRVAEKSDASHLDRCLADYALIRKSLQKPVEARGTDGCIRPEYLFSLIDSMADDDCIFTVDTGCNCVWASHYLTPGKSRSMIGSFTHGSMANALPQAIGAAVGCAGRQVVALCGDGGLSMLMGELLTVIQYHLPIKILVADNRTLGYVQWEMELAGFDPSQVALTNPDFGEMARAIGFQAETVKSPDALPQAISRWLAAEGPALLSVMTDPDAASFVFSREMMETGKPSKIENFIPLGS